MKDLYDWVPWFGELAQKIADGGEDYLVARAKQVDWGVPIEEAPLFNYGDENIDPFSFIYTLASKNGNKQKGRIFRSAADVFDLQEPLWLDNPEACYFPTAFRGTLFHWGIETAKPELLWRLLRGAVQGRDAVRAEDFDGALAIKGVTCNNLTQALLLINGKEFFPYDKTMRALDIGPKVSPGKLNWKSYRQIMAEIGTVFSHCDPAEINLFAYRQKKLKPKPNNCFVVSTNVFDDGRDLWEDFCSNNWVYVGGPKSGRGWGADGPMPENGGYPLTEPNAGDIVLARNGKQGCGVGIVHQNDYSHTLSAEARLHVIWINKSQQTLAVDTSRGLGFMKGDGKWGSAFEKAYAPTFEMLNRLWKEYGVQPDNGGKVKRMTQTHPLNTILYGPPGTGKTFATFKRCVEVCDGEAPEDRDEIRSRYQELSEARQIEFVTFHQSYGYEEFVEGLRPVSSPEGLSLEVTDGVIKRVAERARQLDEPHVLVIDEINRANISKVMGELITLIEEDKREGRSNEIQATLPHSETKFTLPDNLHILGTMNTADRSIALLDVALRRRFEFEEMLPDPGLLQEAGEQAQVDLPKVLDTINARLEFLIDRDHLIGHAWLMDIDSREALDECMRRKIIPLIAEYFFEDWSKVHAVLGGGAGFVTGEQLSAPKGLGEDMADSRVRWRVKDQFETNAYEELTGPSE